MYSRYVRRNVVWPVEVTQNRHELECAMLIAAWHARSEKSVLGNPCFGWLETVFANLKHLLKAKKSFLVLKVRSTKYIYVFSHRNYIQNNYYLFLQKFILISLPSHPGFLAPSLQGTPPEKVFSLRLVEDQTSQLPAADLQHHLRSAQLVALTFGQSLFVQSESPCLIFPSKMSHRYPYILATWEKKCQFPSSLLPSEAQLLTILIFK